MKKIRLHVALYSVAGQLLSLYGTGAAAIFRQATAKRNDTADTRVSCSSCLEVVCEVEDTLGVQELADNVRGLQFANRLDVLLDGGIVTSLSV